mmetsp:Transcript_7315/g.10325  ORF Transcript_7315/g.10325 Transcript_7315/m.10325 type:complete len:102 (+) Transcript_7315:3-308(+)
MRRDIWAGVVFCKAALAVKLEFDMFPMLKYTNEEFVETQIAPILGQTKAHAIISKNSTTKKKDEENAQTDSSSTTAEPAAAPSSPAMQAQTLANASSQNQT